MMLSDDQEIIARLKQVSRSKDSFILYFIIDYAIQLPITAFSSSYLQKFIGQKIGLFQCDGKYYLRKIKP